MSASSDGVLTVTADDARQAVSIWVDFSQLASPPDDSYRRVTVMRDGVIVRGMDARLAPGGMCRGFDAEAPRGVALTYTASITDGVTPILSGAAAAAITHDGRAWLKHLTTPAVSIPVTVRELPAWENAIDESIVAELSGYYWMATQGHRTADAGALRVMTVSAAEREALSQFLLAGGPCLLQCPAAWDEPDRFFTIGRVTRERLVRPGADLYRIFELPLTEVARPVTAGSKVAYPGGTFGDSKVTWPTLGDRSGTFADRISPPPDPGGEPTSVTGYDGGWV